MEQLTEENLKIYISSLKEQIAELESQKDKIYMHPRANAISEFVMYTENAARVLIAHKAGKLKKENENLLSNIAKLANPNPKKQINDFVAKFLRKQDNFDINIMDAIMGMPVPGKYKKYGN